MKFRVVTRKREVPHTLNGITETVNKDETIHVPVLPRDWDHTVYKATCLATIGVTAASVAWSTFSIGDMLSEVVHPVAAYAAASAFDVAWITLPGRLVARSLRQ
ncbi:hypothetical protein ABZ752_15285 [Streptomyces roseifaciens]